MNHHSKNKFSFDLAHITVVLELLWDKSNALGLDSDQTGRPSGLISLHCVFNGYTRA